MRASEDKPNGEVRMNGIWRTPPTVVRSLTVSGVGEILSEMAMGIISSGERRGPQCGCMFDADKKCIVIAVGAKGILLGMLFT